MQTKRIWILHLSSLVALSVWPAFDPLFGLMVQSPSFTNMVADVGWLRVVGLALMAVTAAISLLALLLKLLGRSHAGSPSRSLRQLLAITTVISFWCALCLQHDSIAWQGKRMRFAYRVSELESLVAPLRDQWPAQDGELAQIGPFMAYPFGCPSTLVLLQSPRIASQAVYVCAIERCSDGAIKLQLTGSDGGDWAEWHPPHSRPQSFVGGLADQYELLTATAIGRGWYLVRYA